MNERRYEWVRWGDVNAFFGLMLDNVAVMVLFVVMITPPQLELAGDFFSRDFVLTQMIPGTAFGVLLGDLVFTWLAFRLARKRGRSDVTAMPLGLDTPSTVAVGPLVLLPVLRGALAHGGFDHRQAMFFAWHVGAMVLVLSGIFKTLVAPFGGAVRRLVPRAGLLGSLAAIALVLISFVPLWQHIAPAPLVGMAALTIILVTLVAHRPLPGKIPGALAAVIVGIAVYYFCAWVGAATGSTLVPPLEHKPPESWRLPEFLPAFASNLEWWQRVFTVALSYMPIMLPFALATIVGGIDCTESAAAAGDEFDTRTILLTEGVASVTAGLLGGVIQTTPYIGQPAYKAMGGRAAYTLATALFVGVAGFFGWFAYLFEWLPEAAMFPILVFVGLEITAQSFKATPTHHYAAVALAVVPALAYMATIPLDIALGDKLPPDHFLGYHQALRCLANGFIITSLLWASALAFMMDGKLVKSAVALLVAAACSFVGIIHSPLHPEEIAWPWQVIPKWAYYYELHWTKMTDVMRCQSPYHWTAAYCLAAGLLLLLAAFSKEVTQTPASER